MLQRKSITVLKTNEVKSISAGFTKYVVNGNRDESNKFVGSELANFGFVTTCLVVAGVIVGGFLLYITNPFDFRRRGMGKKKY